MLATYIVGCLALIVKPGPDLMCTVATALADGRRSAATLMAGLVLGCWLWILLLAAGVAPFFASHPAVTLTVQLVGTVYIGHLACITLREAWTGFGADGSDALHPAQGRGWRLVGRGVAMAMSNPLTILFFLAFLPHFTRDGSALAPALQTLLLGTLFCLLVPFIYLPVIFVASALRTRVFGSPRAAAALKLASALILFAVVALLAANLVRTLR